MATAMGGDRFVAHFDILGWRHAVRRDLDVAWKVFEGFSEAHQRVHSYRLEVNGILRARQIESRVFSDTIIISTQSDGDQDLFDLLFRCGELLKDALSRWVPLRGGIAVGSFREDPARNLFAGEALNRAYEIGEAAQWFGVVVDEAVAERARGFAMPYESDTRDPGIVPWDVPLKDEQARRSSVLNWPCVFRENFKAVPTTGEAIMRFVHPIFGPWAALDPAVRRKYDNTSAFIVAQLRDHHERIGRGVPR